MAFCGKGGEWWKRSNTEEIISTGYFAHQPDIPLVAFPPASLKWNRMPSFSASEMIGLSSFPPISHKAPPLLRLSTKCISRLFRKSIILLLVFILLGGSCSIPGMTCCSTVSGSTLGPDTPGIRIGSRRIVGTFLVSTAGSFSAILTCGLAATSGFALDLNAGTAGTGEEVRSTVSYRVSD